MSRVLFVSNPYENLGIEYMSSVLRRSGHQVALVIDPSLFLNPYHSNRVLNKLFCCTDVILKKVEDFSPDMICFSVVTDTYQWALGLAKSIKIRFDIPVVFGGIHATVVPELLLAESCIDYVCVGEGELAVLDLADRISKKDDCQSISNIWTRGLEGIVRNPPRPVIDDLDILPFPDKGIYYSENNVYKDEYFIMTGRGCQYSCSFCCNQILIKQYGMNYVRRRSVDNVIQELLWAKKKYPFKFVWFMDDNFCFSIDWIKEFGRAYKNHIALPFFCYAHPNNMSMEVAALLKDAGCSEVAIGVESLNADTCKFVDRVSEKKIVACAIRALRFHGISSITENILGFPGEGEEDLIRLVEFYSVERPDLVVFSWLKIFPGTRILKVLSDNGAISCEQLKDISEGNDKSLALGGNCTDGKIFRTAACLLVLVPFLPRKFVVFLVNTRLFKLLGVLSPVVLLRVLRIFKSFFIIIGKTHDSGLRVNLRIYKYYTFRIIKIKCVRTIRTWFGMFGAVR